MLLVILAANWIHIPIAALGIVISAVAKKKPVDGEKDKSTAGLVCCIIVLMFGTDRFAHIAGAI